MSDPTRLLGLVWNADQRRLRAPWRLLAAVALFVVVGGVAGLVVSVLAGAAGGLVGVAVADFGVTVAGYVLLAGVAAVVVAFTGRYLDRRRLRDYGFRLDHDWWVDLAFGLALGGGLMTGVFLVELAAGWVVVTDLFVARDGFLAGFALSLALFLAVGFYEELLARGYLLTNVAEGLVGPLGHRGAVVVALGVSAGAFGLVHAANPNASAVSTAAVALAGVVLGLGYVLTDELAVPLGFHVAWNLAQGGLYGFPVSGNRLGASVLAVDQRGPVALTGGAFGPEAGALGVAALLVGALAVVAWAGRRRGEVGFAPGVTRPELRWRGGE